MKRQYIYIMGSTAHPFRYKIGISNNVEFRRANIDKSIKGEVYVIFYAKIWFAYEVEQLLHLLYSPLNAKMKGSGKTEWFWMLLPVTPTIIILTIFLLQYCIIGIIFSTLYYKFTNND